MKPMTRTQRGFTLVELTVVMVIMGIVSVSALPAIDRLGATQQAAAASEVRALLRSARSHAMALGDPTGLSVDPSANTIALLWLAPGGEPSPLLDPLGSPELPLNLSSQFADAGVDTVTMPDGSTTAGTIWFSSLGSLERREEDGEYIGLATTNAIIVLHGGFTVTVDRRTGLIE